MAKLVELQGIGDVFARKLEAAGVASTGDLLAKGATPKGRKEIAAQTGISGDLVLRWVNHVDLFRVKGVGPQYAELLEAAGVDTVVELGKRVPENLLQKLTTTNAEHKKVHQLPTLAQVKNWIELAKQLPRVVKY